MADATRRSCRFFSKFIKVGHTMNSITRRRQNCSIIVTVEPSLLFLLGFMGVAFDFGHLFVVRTELQTAMDACALAAAQELDGRSDAVTPTCVGRATSAGMTAGNLNNVNFQSGTWSAKGKIACTDI